VCAELITRGVALLNGPIDRVWGMRTASFMDRDGHIWEIAQKTGPTTRRSAARSLVSPPC
jgi:uncharacterized glyoxalase superfamily protein PhnB